MHIITTCNKNKQILFIFKNERLPRHCFTYFLSYLDILNKAGTEMGNENLYQKLDSFWKMLDDMAENNEEVFLLKSPYF